MNVFFGRMFLCKPVWSILFQLGVERFYQTVEASSSTCFENEVPSAFPSMIHFLTTGYKVNRLHNKTCVTYVSSNGLGFFSPGSSYMFTLAQSFSVSAYFRTTCTGQIVVIHTSIHTSMPSPKVVSISKRPEKWGNVKAFFRWVIVVSDDFTANNSSFWETLL